MIKKQATKFTPNMVSNHESNNIKFKFHKDRIIHDTGAKTVLVCIDEEITNKGSAVWIAKSLLYKSEWTNYISAYIPQGFTFPVQNIKEDAELSAEQLKECIAFDNL